MMAERATIAQAVQIAVEGTSGTPETSGFSVLQSIGFNVSPQLETRLIRPSGSKYATIAILGKDWTQLGIDGAAAYDDLQFLFASVIGNEAGAVKSHAFPLLVTGPDAVKTLTVQRGESGGSGRYEEAAGVQINELGFNITRSGVDVTGSAFGKSTVFGSTGTEDSGLATLALHPILPEDICVYWDEDYAGLGDTKLERALGVTWNITNRFNPLWVLDCDEDSYVALVEATPEISIELTVEADADGVSFVDDYARVGAKGFLSIAADGGTVDGDAMSLAIDTSVTVAGVGQLGDQDGVYALSIQMQGVIAPWAAAAPGVCNIVLENSMTGVLS